MNTLAAPPRGDLTRRQFIATTAVAGTGLLAGANGLAQSNSVAATTEGERRKRFALVGVGSRSGMYREAIMRTYADHCQMVGFCDVNEGRLKLAQDKARELGAGEIPIFLAADFDRMIRDTKPDVVIVTTKDAA